MSAEDKNLEGEYGVVRLVRGCNLDDERKNMQEIRVLPTKWTRISVLGDELKVNSPRNNMDMMTRSNRKLPTN